MRNPLCDQVVTLYRKTGEGVTRQVLADCFYRYTDCLEGQVFQRKFLLVSPGETEIRPGDRVFPGIGPENVDWEVFLPVTVPGLSQVAYATPRCLEGQCLHYESGR